MTVPATVLARTRRYPVAVVAAPVAALPAPDDPAWRGLLGAAELAYCAGLRRAGEHLAARALARRVVAEALGWAGDVPWRDIAIRREPAGRPAVMLTGQLAEWRRHRRLPVPGVSLSHAAGHAAALAWLP